MKKYLLLSFALGFCVSIIAQQAVLLDALQPSKVFIENKSQFEQIEKETGKEILFATDGSHSTVYFTATGLIFGFMHEVAAEESEHEDGNGGYEKEVSTEWEREYIFMDWANCNPDVRIIAMEKQGDVHHFAIQGDKENYSIDNVHGFKKLVYQNLYPGVDAEYVFHPETGLKYSLTLHPGADLSGISMQYQGRKGSVFLDKNGNLHIPTESGDIIDHAPVSYYQFSENTTIESGFSLQNNTVTLLIPTHDPSKTLIFDPWISNPAFNNANKIWEVETDNSGNIYIMGGDMPIKVRKYNSAGTILWTYTTPWDSSSHWIGTMKVQPITGDVYITAGSQAEIAKLNSGGTQQWLTTGAFTDEYWALAFNCDYTQLVAGGTRITGIPIPTGSGRAFNINMNNGAVISNVTVGTTTAGFLINDINEIRTICYSPNGNFYFLTLDTIGSMTPALALNYRVGSTYRYSYGSPNFGFTPQPQHTIAANGNFIYTHNGVTLHKRSLSTGAIISSIAIPGGGATNLAPFGVGTSPKNGGIALDSCGNVYVGSQTQVHKFDANLSLISSVTTTNAVYDLAVNYSNGEIVACGNGFVASINMSACNPMPVSCNVSFSSSVSGNNIACNGQCTGSATANPSGGSSPFTFLWSNSQTSQTITGLCPGTFTVTISDALGNSSSASVTITQPNPIVINVTGTTPTGCTGSTGTAAVSVSGGTGNITLTWSSNPVQTGPNATNLAAGTYTVTGVDSLGCSVTSGSIVIASTGQANVVISPRTISICKNDTISFIASGALTYVWTPGGSTGNTFTLSPSGSMQVIVTGTDAFGCTDSDTANVIVWPPTATPTITNVGNVLTCNPAAPSYQWYLNGVPINGAISQNHTATQSGNYTVVIRDINECYSSPSAPFFLTGTEPGFQAGIEFEIYPNPTTGIFDLIISTQNNNKKIDVFIADVQGKTIYQATLSVNNSSVTKRIDISGYARGIYTLTLVSEKGMMTRKIEKKE